MEIAAIIISALTLVLVAVLFIKSGRKGADDERAARLESELALVRTELGASLQQASIALSGLITRSGADTRQDVTDRVGKGLTEIRDRVEAQLEKGEMKTGEALEAIKDKVNERLMTIGQQVQAKLDENMKEGFSHFEKVTEHLKKAEAQLIGVSAVGTSINELNNLLKLPHLRGGFGEAALELLIADFLPPSLYEMQAQINPGVAERVDVLVKLPGANLPIDSKFPREQVLPLFETGDETRLAEARKALKGVVIAQAKEIALKYIRPEYGTTDMALMFLPSETLYFEVVRNAEIWGALQRMKVFPVSPNTLAVTLRGITLSFEYYRMAQGVEKTIEDIKKARKHFGHFAERFDGVGRQLDRAKDAYNIASTHLGRYSNSVARLTGEEPDPEQGELPGPAPEK